MSVEFKIGSIFDTPSNSIICHQVNCQGKMGSGVAKQIREKYPDSYKTYVNLCEEQKAKNELESLLGGVIFEEGTPKIANIFGQFNYGYDGALYTDYNALRLGFQRVKDYVPKDWYITIPYKIGCDRGGGDWNIVLSIIEEIFSDFNVLIYKLQ